MGSLSKYINDLKSPRPNCTFMAPSGKKLTDSHLTEFVCLLVHRPNAVSHLILSRTRLSDITGKNMACFVAASSDIYWLDLSKNKFEKETYSSIAKSLYVNASLKILYLFDNLVQRNSCIDITFINALRYNGIRSDLLVWFLYEYVQNEYPRLHAIAQKSTPPSMLEFLLCVHSNSKQVQQRVH